jgi:hypothetical protein
MAIRKSIAWILHFTAKLPDQEEQIRCLRANDNGAVLTVLKFCFDPNIRWALPEGEPPYKPCEYPNIENMLYTEARRLYLFIEGGNDSIKRLKRERMFIDLLESISPDDAKLLVSIKDKKLPFEGLTAETVLKAFPGIF